ncbi:hypothetical protein AALA98_01290 [Lachnospiraceae bacterium 45-W7]
MKRRYAVLLLSVTLGISVLNGCGRAGKGTKTESVATQDKKDEDAVYGEVSQVSDNAITIKVGTRKEMEWPQGETPSQPPGENPQRSSEEQPPGEIPQRSGEQQPSGEAPQKPTDEQPSGEALERPSGKIAGETQMPDGQPGEIPSMLELTGEEREIKVTEHTVVKREKMGGPGQEGTGEEINIEEISEGDTIRVVFAEDGNAEEIVVISGGGPEGGAAPSSQPESYEAVKVYREDVQAENETIHSKGTDENAVLVSSGANAELKKFTVSRDSRESTGGDRASFYGVGAAVLAEEGTAYISDSVIETDAAGGAGIFAYGKGTVYVRDTAVTTSQDTSGGIHAAGGGKLYAWDMEVETNGESAAAVRSDRGGGTIVVDGGNYVANGVGSPAVYSTADIAVHNASLTANGSEAVCIEGRNALRLYNCTLTGTMGEDARNDCVWNVILYQSMSGDAEEGNSTFEMQGGTLKANHGGMFYTTNTESTIVLSEVTLENAGDSAFFLKCTGNQNQRGWGTAGSNGADCLFTAVHQSMEGDIIWDSISQLDVYMTKNSALTGAVVQDESCAENGGEGHCNLYLGEGCTWTVTGDSSFSGLFTQGRIVDDKGKTVTIQGKDGTIYVEGESSYRITVEKYSDTADLSEAGTITDWTEYEVEKPAQFV